MDFFLLIELFKYFADLGKQREDLPFSLFRLFDELFVAESALDVDKLVCKVNGVPAKGPGFSRPATIGEHEDEDGTVLFRYVVKDEPLLLLIEPHDRLVFQFNFWEGGNAGNIFSFPGKIKKSF